MDKFRSYWDIVYNSMPDSQNRTSSSATGVLMMVY